MNARDEQAAAHAGMAGQRSNGVETQGQCEVALGLYTELGMPTAAEIRAHLETLDLIDSPE
ncbi:hypothetical protein [Actinoplanes philippinensis]|nr:hypothetical protein [Actinoplanes philippinensis]